MDKEKEAKKQIEFARKNPVMANKPKIVKDPTRNEDPEEIQSNKLVTEYLLFKEVCANNYMRNWREVQGLIRIKFELKGML